MSKYFADASGTEISDARGELVATPLPVGAMECSECDHVETDAIFLDTETCSKCGGMLTAVDFDD